MTNCTPKTHSFSPLNRKKVQASFTGGCITSDGGLLLLREVDRKLGLTNKLAKLINDDRNTSYVKHSIISMLRQRVYAIAAGYEDVNDHETLRKDLCLQTTIDSEKTLASEATLSRFENRVDRTSLIAISIELVEHFIRSHPSAPKELILDFDPTDHQLHGHQDQRHYHGYYKGYCFLPMHVFCGEQLLVSMLRPGNLDAAKYAGAILRLLVKRFREVWPNVKIIFRGDCAFARVRILHYCEKNGVEYVVGIAGNKRLQKLAKPLAEKAKTHYEETDQKQRLFDEYSYQAEKWKCKRRVIAKSEHHSNGTNLRFVITNLSNPPKEIYEDGYCPRGDMENGIKQLKLDLHSDRNSCTRFYANQFRLLLSSIAYVLLTTLKTTFLSGTSLANVYCGTLRLKLIKMGAIILKNTRRIQFLLSSSFPYQNEFQQAYESLVST